jgi:hypothetical protein
VAKISITSETARRIVEAGTERVYSSVQELKKPERTQQKVQQSGHLKGATLGELVGPYNTVSVRIHSGATPLPEYSGVSCPLLEENERLPALTSVIISKNLRTGRWEIIHWREHHGHYKLQTTKKLTGPNQSDLITFPDGFQRYVSCPLLRPNDSIEKGATVIVSYNEQTKKYEIIETPCPAASAAALPDEGEDAEDQPLSDDPEDGE